MMNQFFRVPFALSGDKAVVPVAADPGGTVSYIQGYGPDYALPKTNPSSKNIEREKLNQLHYAMTLALSELQSQGIPDFITSALNGGTPYSYAINAVVRWTDDQLYYSLVSSNVADPSDATKWAPFNAVAALANPALGDLLVAVLSSLPGSVATTQHQVNEENYSLFRPMTAAQIAAVVAGLGAGGAECSAALQAAIDSGAGLQRAPDGRYMLGTPLRIKSGNSRVSIRGGHRIRTIFSPNANSIAVAPVSVNALIINQENNPHFCLENFRMYSTNSFNGVGIYAKEAGGSDGSTQAAYSCIWRNGWVDFSSTNSGFFTGALQNSIVDTFTFENMKGLFTFEGAANADVIIQNVQLYNCFDHVILQTADTQGSKIMTVRGVHCYTHQRGRLVNVQNWGEANLSDFILEPATGNLGNTGLFKFKDSVALNVSNFIASTRAGVPACAVGIELEGTQGKFSEGQIEADLGLVLTGTSAVDLDFVNVDFTKCTTAALQFAANTTGTIRTRGCKFNDSTLSGILSSVANAVNWFSYDDEFLNAGLGGSASTRNIILNTSGTVVMTNPRIGRTNPAAAAGYFIEAIGSGTVTIIDPIWVGVAPIGRKTGAQAINFMTTAPTGVAVLPVGFTSYTVDVGDAAVIVQRTAAGNTTLTLPVNADFPGRVLRINNYGTQPVVSASANVYPLTGGALTTAIVAAGKYVELLADGTGWRTVAGN